MANPIVAPPQTTTYTVVVNDGEGSVSRNVTVTVYPLPIVTPGSNQTIPHGTNTMITAAASGGNHPYAFLWSPSDKVIAPTMPATPTVNLFSTQVFTVTVTDNTGCVSSAQTIVSIEGGPLHVNPAAVDSVICRGETTQIQALPGGGSNTYETYQWTSNPPGFTSTQPNPTVTPQIETEYTVEVYDGYNIATGSVTVKVNQLPLISLLPVNDPRIQIIDYHQIGVCVFDTVTLNAGNPGSEFLWSNGSDEQSISIQTSGISFDYQKYLVTVTNLQTGCVNTDSITAIFTFQNCSYGMDESDPGSGLTVFPNPSGSGIFNCRIEGLKGTLSLDVYSAQAALVHSQPITMQAGVFADFVLPLDHLSPGIYFLKLTGPDVVLLRKLIIQKI